MTAPQATSAATTRALTDRLDRLPFTGEHRRLLLGSGIGWAFDALDVGLISFVIAALAAQWELSAGQQSWIVSAGFVGMALGAALGGLLADRFGRRTVFAATLAVYGLATGASALVASVGALIALRVLVGLGLGAELPVASTLVSELAPARIRGRVVVWLEAFWAVGWLGAALVGYLVVPRGDDGWRWALAIGALPALYAVAVRAGLPESVRFLLTRGRSEEAEAVVTRFERSAGVAGEVGDAATSAVAATDASGAAGRTAEAVTGVLPGAGPGTDAGAGADVAADGTAPALDVDEATTVPEDAAPVSGVRRLWQADLRPRTVAIWLTWFMVNFSYYGAFIWIPSILHAEGHTLVRSFGFTLVMTLAQLPGYAAAAWLVERWGRRTTLVVFLAGSAVSAWLFGTAGGTEQLLTAGLALSFFNLGAWGALYAITPELYPTRLRGTGAGWAAGAGRIASILAPLLVPVLREAGGTSLLFAVFAAAFVVAGGAALTLPELRGHALAD